MQPCQAPVTAEGTDTDVVPDLALTGKAASMPLQDHPPPALSLERKGKANRSCVRRKVTRKELCLFS